MEGNGMEEQRRNEAVTIISNKMLRSVYQPIVSLSDGSVFAYEALSRITYEDATINISELFESAAQMGYLWELEKICRTNALKNAVGKPNGVKLFINVDGNVLSDSKFIKGFTKEKLRMFSLKAEDVVFEITERSNCENHRSLSALIKHYREQGFEVALDDLGAGYSGLNRLQNIQPEYVKIDYELVHEIQRSKWKKSLVRMLVRHCREMDYRLIAEGIETEEELRCIIHLGVNYGQGFLLGKPNTSFCEIDRSIVKMIDRLQRKQKAKRHEVGKIGRMGTIVYPACSVEYVADLFEQNNDLLYIGVVDEKCKFCGLIYRDTFSCNASGEKHMGMVAEKIMDRDVLMIDADKSIKEAIVELATRDEKNFYKPFVIIRKENYFGIATARDMLLDIGKDI